MNLHWFARRFQARSYGAHPGGKGLNLAVAGARMGLKVRLIAAIGDDPAGRTLRDYMDSEGLITDLVEEIPDAVSPVALVTVLPNGDSATVGWQNESEVELSPGHLVSPAVARAMADADAVLVTLEPPVHVVRWALESASRNPDQLVLLQAAPPLDQPQEIYPQLSGVDYVVGTEWALRGLLPNPAMEADVDELARQLRGVGIGTVCVVEQFSCRIRSKDLNAEISAPPTPLDESPGSREAFSGALVHHLLGIGRDLTRDALEWACAAMAVNLDLTVITDAMPLPEQVLRKTGPKTQNVG